MKGISDFEENVTADAKFSLNSAEMTTGGAKGGNPSVTASRDSSPYTGEP